MTVQCLNLALTSQINRGDVTIISQKRPYWAIDDFCGIVCSGYKTACKEWNNPFVTGNNDFLVTRYVICQWFSLVTSSLVKSIGSLVTSSLVKIIGKSAYPWPKIGIHDNSCIILYIMGSDNGLSPGRHQAIIWNSDKVLSIWTLGTNFSEISIETHMFSFKKMQLHISSVKCLGFSVLTKCL